MWEVNIHFARWANLILKRSPSILFFIEMKPINLEGNNKIVLWPAAYKSVTLLAKEIDTG